MPKSWNRLSVDRLGKLIYEIRGQRVMLDSDLAKIYGVETKALNRAVNRNRSRFPTDFAFQVSSSEWKNLRCQIGTSSSSGGRQRLRSQIATSKSHGGRRYLPYVFTEHGAIMAANILNSRRAVQMRVFVVRAFLKMRALLGDKRKEARLRYLSRYWMNKLKDVPEIRFNTSFEPNQSCAIANPQIEGTDPKAVTKYLFDKHEIFTVPIIHEEFQGIRVTPNLYTTLSELDRFCDQMQSVAKNGLPACKFKSKDIFRASRLSLLGISNYQVKRTGKKSRPGSRSHRSFCSETKRTVGS